MLLFTYDVADFHGDPVEKASGGLKSWWGCHEHATVQVALVHI